MIDLLEDNNEKDNKRKPCGCTHTHTHTGILRDKKGITLITLVITIIVLLLLSGVVIVTLTGENGLFARAKQAKEKQTEAEIKEKINILISEYIIEREKGELLVQFLTEKKAYGEIDDFIDDLNGTYNIIINGYSTSVNENDLSITEPEMLGDINIVYVAKKFINGYIEIVITVESKGTGIKEIELPENKIIQANNKNKVSIDYTIEPNKTYDIIIQNTKGEKKTKTIIYQDNEPPTAEIEIPQKTFFNSAKIKANVKIKDNRSGINVSECRWVVNKTSNSIGIDEELYIGGIFISENQGIQTDNINEEGEYYIHVLLKDNIGNTTEVISEKIEILNGYEISTPEGLQAIKNDINGKYYLTKDIDMTNFEFEEIAGFAGVLDGQGHEIYNFSISGINDIGMIHYIHGATIKNILFKNVNITSSNGWAGLVVGQYSGNSIIEKVGITGTIKGNRVGSFCSYNSGNSITFKNCYARTNLYGSSQIGGFTGGYWYGGAVFATNCYWAGTMNLSTKIGTFEGSSSSDNKTFETKPNLTNCYYNNKTFTIDVPEEYSGTGLKTEQFSNNSNFVNWDFSNDWYISEEGYPELKFN